MEKWVLCQPCDPRRPVDNDCQDHGMMVLLPRRDHASVLLHLLVRQSRPLCVSTHCSEHRLLLGVATGTRVNSPEGEHAISASELSESWSSSSCQPLPVVRHPNAIAAVGESLIESRLRHTLCCCRRPERQSKSPSRRTTLAVPSTGCDQSLHQGGVSSHGSGWSPT